MKIRFKSIKRGIKNFFRRDDREDEYRGLAIKRAKIQKSHANTPRQGKAAADDVASIASARTVEENPKEKSSSAEEVALLITLPREVADAAPPRDTAMRVRQTRQVADHLLQLRNGPRGIPKRNFTMPELTNVRSRAEVEHNVPLGREEVVPVRRRSSMIARAPVESDQRYSSFVRF